MMPVALSLQGFLHPGRTVTLFADRPSRNYSEVLISAYKCKTIILCYKYFINLLHLSHFKLKKQKQGKPPHTTAAHTRAVTKENYHLFPLAFSFLLSYSNFYSYNSDSATAFIHGTVLVGMSVLLRT